MEFKKGKKGFHNASEAKKQNNTAKKKSFSVLSNSFSVRYKRNHSLRKMRQAALVETIDDLNTKSKTANPDGIHKKRGN